MFSSCTDIVFFIYLYQRWIYRVDPKRFNEYGTSGEDHTAPPQLQLQDTPPSEVGTDAAALQEEVAKTDQEKKDD